LAPKEAQPLLIFPHNGNGVEALDCLGEGYSFVGFIDDTPEKQGTDSHGYRVMGRAALWDLARARVLAVPGGPSSYRSRKEIVNGLGLSADRFATVIHPAARVSPLAVIGYNVLIMAGTVVTSNAVIGNHVCILPNTVLHHDVVVGTWSLIGSNVTLAGGAVIGDNCYIGSASSVMNGLRVGDGALVGLGSNVIRSVPPGATVVGNPARQI
jgi:sugar O-acyltransferase (sialic acid O-acetyltransferase NeuD family)